MIEFAALTYAFTTSFILSSVSGNNRHQRQTPKIVVAVGYFLCGTSATLAAALAGAALSSLR